MIRWVLTRATYTICEPSSTDADTLSCTRSESASMNGWAMSGSCNDET